MASFRSRSISTALSGSSKPVTRSTMRSAQADRVRAARSAGRTVSSQTRHPSSSRRSALRIRLPSSVETRSSWRPAAGRQSLSFSRTVLANVIVVSQGFHRVVRAVEGEHGRLLLDDGVQVDRPTPNILDIRQRISSTVQFQVDSVMLMTEQQLAPIAMVAVHHVYPRLAKVCQTEQQPLLYLLKFPRVNHVLFCLIVEHEREQLMFLAELRSQERLDKGNIVMNAANLEDFLPSQTKFLVPGSPFRQIVTIVIVFAETPGVPAVLDIAEKLDAQLVGIDPGPRHGHGP